MSHFDYEVSKKIVMEDPPFYAIIMAAMMKADSMNLKALQIAFPSVWDELKNRYAAPDGILEGER